MVGHFLCFLQSCVLCYQYSGKKPTVLQIWSQFWQIPANSCSFCHHLEDSVVSCRPTATLRVFTTLVWFHVSCLMLISWLCWKHHGENAAMENQLHFFPFRFEDASIACSNLMMRHIANCRFSVTFVVPCNKMKWMKRNNQGILWGISQQKLVHVKLNKFLCWSGEAEKIATVTKNWALVWIFSDHEPKTCGSNCLCVCVCERERERERERGRRVSEWREGVKKLGREGGKDGGREWE